MNPIGTKWIAAGDQGVRFMRDVVACGETEEERSLLSAACAAIEDGAAGPGCIVIVDRRAKGLAGVVVARDAELGAMLAAEAFPSDMADDIRAMTSEGRTGVVVLLGDVARLHTFRLVASAGQA